MIKIDLLFKKLRFRPGAGSPRSAPVIEHLPPGASSGQTATDEDPPHTRWVGVRRTLDDR
jgi:hypothetical protein